MDRYHFRWGTSIHKGPPMRHALGFPKRGATYGDAHTHTMYKIVLLTLVPSPRMGVTDPQAPREGIQLFNRYHGRYIPTNTTKRSLKKWVFKMDLTAGVLSLMFVRLVTTYRLSANTTLSRNIRTFCILIQTYLIFWDIVERFVGEWSLWANHGLLVSQILSWLAISRRLILS